jgi:hypothetical protein
VARKNGLALCFQICAIDYSEYPFLFDVIYDVTYSISQGTTSVRGISPALTDVIIHMLSITEAQYPAGLATSQGSWEAETINYQNMVRIKVLSHKVHDY